MDAIQQLSLLVGGFVLPIAYLILFYHMRNTPKAPIIPYFVIFGTVGGWMLAIALSPSGLAASSIVFLMTIGLLSLIATHVYLALISDKTKYHKIAIILCYSYYGIIASLLIYSFASDN